MGLLVQGWVAHAAIPYRARTGPEQGFPCLVFPHMENPVFISWDSCNENRFIPDGNTIQGNPCFHYRDRFAVKVCTLGTVHRVFYPEKKSKECALLKFSKTLPVQILTNFLQNIDLVDYF